MSPSRVLIAVLSLALLGLSATSAPATATSTASATSAAATTTADPAARAASATKLEAKTLKLINKRRKANGCKPLKRKAKLAAASRAHTELMVASGTLAHQLPGEASLPDRVSATGYRWSRLSENLAVGQPGAKAVVRAWLGSPAHRQNLLDCGLRHTGLTAVRDGRGTMWWTQVFAKR